MLGSSLNEGWRTGPKAGQFAGLAGPPPPPRSVTLLHDAMIERDRDADVPGGAASGYFPGGAYAYQKTFNVPEAYR